MEKENIEIQTYAKIATPGAMLKELNYMEVGTRDMDNIEFPKGVGSVQFFDIMKGGDIKEIDERFNLSPTIVIGKYLSLADIAEKYGEGSILYQNTQRNGYSGVAEVVGGQVWPVGEEDIVVSPDKIVYEEEVAQPRRDYGAGRLV